MDFFERAHVVKKDSSRKDSKSEEATKKQLKQMLFGFKQSDTKLLKSCEDVYDSKKFIDDSSSVSGFSDLNLTNSSNEAEKTRESVEFDEDSNISDVDKLSSNNSDSFNLSHNSNENPKSDSESISEYGVNNLTLSDVVSDMIIEASSDISNDSSIIKILSDTTSDKNSDDSDFDPNGELAMKILERLGKKKVVTKSMKRKLESETQVQQQKVSKSKPKIKEKSKHHKIISESKNTKAKDKNEKNRDAASESSIDEFSDSPAFISIEASDMPDQSLSEILGEYKHPTMRNLPSDIQVTHSTNNSGTFSIEDMSVDDIEIQEESHSFTPENNDNTIDEADLDSTDIDNSIAPLTEDTSIYDETFQSEPTSDKEASFDSVDDSFESPIKYFFGHNNCIFVLKHPTELYIHGKVIVKALGGTLDLFGYRLKDEPCQVYAPNYNYAHCIKTVESQNLYNGLFGKLIAEGVSVTDAEEIVTMLGENDGVISLKKLNSRKMDFVENNMSPTDIFSKVSRNIEPYFKKVSEILGCSLYLNRQWKTFEEVTCWRKVAEYGLGGQSRGIVCGGKGVGKSTFLRYCVNRLLSKGPVLVLDLDPGQAEFTVAGNISATIVEEPLLGPNFTHLKTPEMMLNLGMINTMDNPRRYAAAVGALISHCCNNEQLKSMPWIINTMGLCNAMGLKFMTLTILQAQPTYLLQIDSKNAKKRFEMYLDSYTTKRLYQENYKNDPLFKNLDVSLDYDYSFFVAHHTDNPVKKSYSLAARDERYLNFLAYFGDLLTTKEQTNLLGIVPYEVNLGDLHIGLNIKIREDAVTKVINGKIIALCQLTTRDKGGDVFTLKDKPVLCHGHGLVRGVDLEKQTLYIITPLSVDKLSLVNTLVYADWVPEMRGQEKHLPDGISVPYRTETMYQKRQLMFAPKRRFNPLQLLKMTRNS